MKRSVFFCLLIFICWLPALQTRAQQGTTINLTDSKQPEDKKTKLRSEKTTYGKLPPVKKFFQNTYTHFNYLFNANLIFNQIMEDAVTKENGDYNQLISFYPYDINALASDKRFDSVIQHATQGLLLHDLRNDYVDELYFLIGESHFFKKNYDTAQQTFKYINYAFAPKDDGYNIPIGSNVSNKNDKNFSISNKESTNFFKKNNLKNLYRRNDALLWLAKDYIEQNNFTDANILLNNIGRDKYFPERLMPLYYETRAYFFYKQKMYDSAANYLSQCYFDNDTKRLKARRYYLTAQLYQLSDNDTLAINFYNKTLNEANNPELEIYAKKNIIQLRNKTNASTEENNELHSLLKKNKYYNYKDLIYYNEAEIAAQNKDDKNAENLLWQSIKANRNALVPNRTQQSRTFFLLGNIDYDHYRFDSASRHYDSVSAPSIKDSLQRRMLTERQPPLKLMAANYDSIHVKDSLLALANMSEKERMAILKQKAKAIRKAIDKRDETNDNTSINNFQKQNQNQQSVDLFAQQTTGAVWYFNNPTAKNAGYQLFKQKFGNRQNVDEWLISSLLTQSTPIKNNPEDTSASSLITSLKQQKIDSAEITAEDLLATLPMTDSQKVRMHASIAALKFRNAEILMNKLGNYKAAIVFFDSLINNNPKAYFVPNALYDKFVCYTLLGDDFEAGELRDKILREYASSEWADKINKAFASPDISPASIANTATKEYSDIYDLFLAGKFDSAIQLKTIADKKYGTFYWTPQLLYIEALYNANKRNDTAALHGLDYIITKFSTSPMKRMATDLKNILLHRKEIEDYLKKLNIKPESYSDFDLEALEKGAQRMQQEQRIIFPKDSLVKYDIGKIDKENQDMSANSQDLINHDNTDTTQVAAANNPPTNDVNNVDSLNNVQQNKNTTTDTTKNLADNNPVQNNNQLPKIDSSKNQQNNNTITDTTKNLVDNNPVQNNNQLPKIDSSKNQQNNNTVNTSPAKTDSSQNVVKSRPSEDSTKNINQNIATNNPPENKNTDIKKPVQQNQTENNKKPETQSARTFDGFLFDDNAPTYVTVVLDNVDPVYSTEAANVFNRYNLLTFPNNTYNVNPVKADDQTLILIGPFKNLEEAKAYQANVQPHTGNEIIPWISADKYSFIKISPQNINKIHSKSDIQKYKNASEQAGME